MSVDKRGKKWRVRWRTPDGQQHQRTFDTETEAKLYDATVTVDHANGRYRTAETKRITVREYADVWIRNRRRLAPGTVDRYKGILDTNILPVIGDQPLAQLRPAHIDDLIDALTAQELAPATVAKAVNVVSQVCDRAIRDELLDANPCRKADLPSKQRREMLYCTPAEVGRLAAVMDPQPGLMVRVAAYTGLRWGELVALTAADVDLMRKRVRVDKQLSKGREVARAKTDGSRRWVPLEAGLLDDLGALVQARRGTTTVTPSGKPLRGLLFASPRETTLNPSNFRRDHWKPAKVDAGLDPALRWHDLRHTCATWLINEGADPYRVMKWLGHTNINTTISVYSHLLPDRLDDLTDMLAAVKDKPGDGPASIAKVSQMGS